MKLKPLTALLAILASLAIMPAMASAASFVLPFQVNYGAGPDTLTAPAGAIVSGVTDNWFIDLSQLGISLCCDNGVTWIEDAPGRTGFDVMNVFNNGVELRVGINNPTSACGGPLSLGTTCLIGTDDTGLVDHYYASVTETTAAPEPASIALLGSGLMGSLFRARRRRKV